MFRLLNLKLFRRRVIGSINLDFDKSGVEYDSPYVTVMIGKNGVGKSQILCAICEIFNYIYSLNNYPEQAIEPAYDFEITWYLDGKEYKASRKSLRNNLKFL